jgi:hypothetical protein
MPADAVSMEDMAAVEPHWPSIRLANIALADVINLLIRCFPLQCIQLFSLDLPIFERFDVGWSFSILGPVLLDLHHAANGDAGDQQSRNNAEDDESCRKDAKLGLPTGLVPSGTGQAGSGRITAVVTFLAVLQNLAAWLRWTYSYQQK